MSTQPPADLIEFLRSRYKEEAAQAEKQRDGDDYPLDPWEIRWEETGEWNSYAYIRITKSRALAEVEAKRDVVAQYERALENRRAHPDDLAAAGALLALLGTLKSLALPYAGHPGYKPRWAPTA